MRLLLGIFDCVGGVVLVEVDCGCGWKALRRVLSRVSLVLDRKCRCRPYGVACVACRAKKLALSLVALDCVLNRRCESRRCWWCVNGIWLGGVVRDMDGGVLWRGFFGVVGFTHAQPNRANSIRLRKKSCYMEYGVYAGIAFKVMRIKKVWREKRVNQGASEKSIRKEPQHSWSAIHQKRLRLPQNVTLQRRACYARYPCIAWL